MLMMMMMMMAKRAGSNLENLERGTRHLSEFNVGDWVRIQNQVRDRLWCLDLTGEIVESKGHQ